MRPLRCSGAVFSSIGRLTDLIPTLCSAIKTGPVGAMRSPVVDQDPQQVRGDAALGSGLSWPSYSALLGMSISLFVFWSGALWRSQPHDSHFARFAVSYFAVVKTATKSALLNSPSKLESPT